MYNIAILELPPPSCEIGLELLYNAKGYVAHVLLCRQTNPAAQFHNDT